MYIYTYIYYVNGDVAEICLVLNHICLKWTELKLALLQNPHCVKNTRYNKMYVVNVEDKIYLPQITKICPTLAVAPNHLFPHFSASCWEIHAYNDSVT